MKTAKNLYPKIYDFQNLMKAAQLSQRGKRHKNATAFFNMKLENELWRLHSDLKNKTYAPGPYRDFVIFEPKRRVISAATYRDRVLHHAIYNVLEPVFDPGFIFDSYATRKGKGTHAALQRFKKFSRSNQYVLKCDIKKYFPNIRHDILMREIKRKIACSDTLGLIEKILGSHDVCGKEIAQPASQPASQRGIPIGNLTSQFFANIYLNCFDYFVKEKLGCRHYIRYMDDFVLFSNHKDGLFVWLQKIHDFLNTNLALSLHEHKCKIFKTGADVPFLGLVYCKKHIRIRGANIVRFKRRMKYFSKGLLEKTVTWQTVHQSVQSWIGHVKHADTYNLRKLVLGDIILHSQEDEGSLV